MEIGIYKRVGMIIEFYVSIFPRFVFFCGLLGRELWIQRKTITEVEQ